MLAGDYITKLSIESLLHILLETAKNKFRNLRLELRKTNIASWRNDINRKENLTQNVVANLVRHLENKLPVGNIRKLLIELMLRKFRLELRKQNIVGWTLEE